MRVEKKFIPWIFSHFIEFWYFYIGAVTSLYVLHTSQVEIPILAKQAGDQILAGKFESSLVRSFVFYALLIIIFRTLSRWLFFFPARVQQKNLRIEILKIITTKNPQVYRDYSFGQLYQVLLSDFERVRGFVGFALLQIGNLIIAIWVLYPKISAIGSNLFIAFIPMFLSVVLFSVVMYFFQPFMKKGVEIQGDVQNRIIETFDAKMSVANFQKEESFYQKFSEVNRLELNYFFKGSLGPAIARPLVPFGVAISLLWGAQLIFEANLEVTQLILYSGFLFLALEPLMFLSWIGVVITSFIPSWKRIKKLIKDLDREVIYNGELICSKERVKFNTQIWDNHQIFLEQKLGEISGVCGPTGIGKSYLFDSLVSFYDKEKLDFNYVMQEPHLFDGNIIDNVLLGEPLTDKLKEEIEELIKIFHLSDLAPTLDQIFQTEVGENGKKLSGGQIKRFALIQSLISKSNYLIWDDPFSSVDNILELEIMRTLKAKGFLDNKFLVLSTHRVTTLQHVQKILFIEDKVHSHDSKLGDEKLNEFFQFQMA